MSIPFIFIPDVIILQRMKVFQFLILIVLFCFSCQPAPKSSNQPKEQKLSQKNAIAGGYNVAFLIMDGTYNTEFTAPYDIFQHTRYRDNIRAMNTFSVANTSDAITTFEGLRILPDYDYTRDSLPSIDILVVPSAEHHLDTDLQDTVMLEFVRKVSDKAQFVTSHCDGAFVLAKAGLLQGTVSTTFPSDINTFRAMFPQLEVKDSLLFVHDGKFITSAGGAKSFEAALYLCEMLYGKEIARSLAKGLVIDWNLDEVPHLILQ